AWRAAARGSGAQTRRKSAARLGSSVDARIAALYRAAALTSAGPPATKSQMDVRHREVLIAVIREYIDSAEPVGSRVLTKRHFPNLSPATIRNTMSDLEDLGYLAQPHTRDGRAPTDAAHAAPVLRRVVPAPSGGLACRRVGGGPTPSGDRLLHGADVLASV